ncbi:hypothetical protein IKO70_09240 [bacterium]|nr:hypothetical protein [bacterium]
MKKIIEIIFLVLTVFILSCGGNSDKGDKLDTGHNVNPSEVDSDEPEIESCKEGEVKLYDCGNDTFVSECTCPDTSKPLVCVENPEELCAKEVDKCTTGTETVYQLYSDVPASTCKCRDSKVGWECACEVGGKIYNPGDHFLDWCNWCSCSNSGIADCTEEDCGGVACAGDIRVYHCKDSEMIVDECKCPQGSSEWICPEADPEVLCVPEADKCIVGEVTTIDMGMNAPALNCVCNDSKVGWECSESKD